MCLTYLWLRLNDALQIMVESRMECFSFDPKEDECIHSKVRAVAFRKSPPKKRLKTNKKQSPLLLAPLAGATLGSRGWKLPWLASGIQHDAAVAQLEWGERLQKAQMTLSNYCMGCTYETSHLWQNDSSI